jgi:hypothetical protein
MATVLYIFLLLCCSYYVNAQYTDQRRRPRERAARCGEDAVYVPQDGELEGDGPALCGQRDLHGRPDDVRSDFRLCESTYVSSFGEQQDLSHVE